jgi:hypothetical protein
LVGYQIPLGHQRSIRGVANAHPQLSGRTWGSARRASLLKDLQMDTTETVILKFNQERWSKWVSASMAWGRNDPDGVTVTRLQGLGILDAELYDINRYEVEKRQNGLLTVYDHANIKSYLWVLGVYEFFRMMDDKIRKNPAIANAKATQAISETKKVFARLRVPLAKLEESHKYKGKDYAVPKLGANEEQLAWQINDSEIIYYRGLSDLAIDTLNELRLSNYEQNEKLRASE